MGSELDHFTITPSEAAGTPDQCAASGAQRLRIHVPHVQTTLSMGEKAPDSDVIRPEDLGDPNFTGFGVSTRGHVFVNARNANKADSQVKVQARGNLTLQATEGSAYISSACTSVVHGHGRAMVGSDGNLVIAGGTQLGPPEHKNADASASPHPPALLNTISGELTGIESYWKSVDSWCAALEIGITGASTAAGLYNNWGSVKGLDAALAVGRAALEGWLAAWGGDWTTFGEGLASKIAPQNGGTVIHGAGGLVLGSHRSAGLFSTIGTTVGSYTSAGMIAPVVGMTALYDGECKALGGGFSVYGMRGAELVSSFKGTEVSSRRGPVAIHGTSVGIGGKANGSQRATDNVNVLATKGVQISAAYSATFGTTAAGMMSAGSVHIAGGDTAYMAAPKSNVIGTRSLTLSSKEKVVLAVGEASVVAKPDEISIGMGSAVSPGAPPAHPFEKLDYDSFWKLAFDDKGNPSPGFCAAQQFADGEHATAMKKWQAEVETAKSTNRMVFKKDTIELIVGGMKFKVDDNKVKSGSIVWKK